MSGLEPPLRQVDLPRLREALMRRYPGVTVRFCECQEFRRNHRRDHRIPRRRQRDTGSLRVDTAQAKSAIRPWRRG